MRLNFSFPIINLKRTIYIILTVIILDQISKIYIKLNFPLTLYGDDAILDYGFFKLLFIENKGMAWGTKLSDFVPFLDDEISKLLLSIIRIVAIIFLGYWIKKSLQEKSANSLLLSLCLIFAGAVGNLLDSIFYGAIFSHSYGQIATFLPEEGYAPFFLVMLLTCFNSLSFLGYGLSGFLLLEENHIHFLNMFLILLTPLLVWV